MSDYSQIIGLLDVDERDCILELLIQNAVDNNDQKSLAILKKLSISDPDGTPIDIDWDTEIISIRKKIKGAQ